MEEYRSHSETAMGNFRKGYNCAQSFVLAYQDVLGMDEATLSRLACSFGGGMGRLREVCGAVSGMLMVAGLLYGYSGPETGTVKAEHYARVQELAHEFERRSGHLLCRDLLGLTVKSDAPTPEARTEEYYNSRPCLRLIGCAADILDSYIAEHGIPEKEGDPRLSENDT